MSYYLYPLKAAALFFFVLIQFIAIPILAYQYKKEGALTFTKGLVIYSFIFYLITAFFMTLLPLPSHEFVDSLTSARMQLIPFMFVKDIIHEAPFRLFDPVSYLKTLTDPVVLQVLFNVVLTIPFGVYLRYYFKKDLKTVIGLTFLMSLFYEITQITGLYGFYSRPFRLFDVDDLMLNTFGGFVGYQITPFILTFFPSRKVLDERVEKASQKIPVFRRVLAFHIDFSILTWTIGLLFGQFTVFTAILSAIALSVINVSYPDQSLGLKFMNLRIIKNDESELDFKTMLKRNLTFYLTYNLVFFFSLHFFEVLNTQYYEHTWMILIYLIITFSAQLILGTHLIMSGLIRKAPLFHEKISGTYLENTLHPNGEDHA